MAGAGTASFETLNQWDGCSWVRKPRPLTRAMVAVNVRCSAAMLFPPKGEAPGSRPPVASPTLLDSAELPCGALCRCPVAGDVAVLPDDPGAHHAVLRE